MFHPRQSWAFALVLMSPVAAALAAPSDWKIVRADLLHDGRAVRITYRDGRTLLVKKNQQADAFDQLSISADRESVGWSISERVDASYPVDADFEVYRDGKPMPGIDDSGTGIVQSWSFWAGGKQIVLCSAFPHGLPSAHLDLYDVATGKHLGTVDVDDNTGKVPANAPAWAKPSGN